MAKGKSAGGRSGIRPARAKPSTKAGKGRARTSAAGKAGPEVNKPDKGTRAERIARIEARAGARYEAGQKVANSRSKKVTLADKAKAFHKAVVSGKRAFKATAALGRFKGK